MPWCIFLHLCHTNGVMMTLETAWLSSHISLCVCFFLNLIYVFIYLWLHVGFLQLWQAGATLVAAHGLLLAVASLAVEHRL